MAFGLQETPSLFATERLSTYSQGNMVDGLWVAKSEGAGLIVHAISFQDFQRM